MAQPAGACGRRELSALTSVAPVDDPPADAGGFPAVPGMSDGAAVDTGCAVVAGVVVCDDVQPAVINAMQSTASRRRKIPEFFMSISLVRVALKNDIFLQGMIRKKQKGRNLPAITGWQHYTVFDV
jgi:hypothetical protein